MKVNESFCTGLERPALVQDCYDTRYPTCTPLWQAGDYGEVGNITSALMIVPGWYWNCLYDHVLYFGPTSEVTVP